MSQITQFLKNNPLETLTGNTGIAAPVAGNIDVIGTTGIVVTASLGRLEISSSSSLSQIDTDSGSVVPSLGLINLLGGTNLNTSGSGNTARVNLDSSIALAGQVQANDIEVITTITAIHGNISTVNGNISSGASISAGANISAGAELSALGDGAIGGKLTVTGNISSIAGDITGNGKLTVSGDIQSTLGDAYINSGNLTVSGNITAGSATITTLNVTDLVASGTIEAGLGLTVNSGGATISSGDLSLVSGGISASGDIDAGCAMSSATTATVGTNLIVGNNASVGAVLTVGNNITSNNGDLAILSGTITGSGNIISNSGNISTGSGSIDSGSTMSATNDITSNSGDIVSLNGDIKAVNGGLDVDHITVTCDITTTANVNCVNLTASGKVIAGTDVEVQSGDLYLNTGNLYTIVGDIWANRDVDAMYGGLYAPNGDCVVGYDMVANSDITSILGDITASNGYILAKYSFETTHGDMICHTGDIRTGTGFIRSADKLIADKGILVYAGGITSTGTTTLNDLSTGVMQTSSSGVVSSSTGTDGQILIANTASTAPVWANVTSADSSVTITNGSGTIDLKTNALFWVEQTTTSVTMAENTCYITNNVALVTCTLPTTCAVGKRFILTGKGAGGWKIAQQAGQTIYGATASTTGVGGSLASTATRDSVGLVCVTANVDFNVIESQGNLTII
jgi:hypothetical protein